VLNILLSHPVRGVLLDTHHHHFHASGKVFV
jgi:hypothetical protein